MLESQSVKELQNKINSRQISIKEVVEYYLDRIEKLNPDLNAIVLQKDRELIIKEAIEKDKAKEIDKSLNGLPIAITQSPILDLSEFPNFTGRNFSSESIFNTAISMPASAPITSAL